MWTVRAILSSAAEYLASRGVETARLDSELMLADVLGVDRMELYVEPERVVTDGERARLRALVRRRGEREPAQHILGSAGFYGLDIRTDPRALIPRRETELLVDRAREIAGGKPVRALDLGTGSGSIACALAKNLADGSGVWATDISGEALALARENAEALKLADRITFLEGDLFEALDDEVRSAPFDVIVTNLPYVPSGEFETLAPEVRDNEPRVALDGGPDGLSVVRRAVEAAPAHVAPGGWMLLEVGETQADAVAEMLKADGFEAARPLRDPGGIDRVAQGRRPE